jgi:hypothetical protein
MVFIKQGVFKGDLLDRTADVLKRAAAVTDAVLLQRAASFTAAVLLKGAAGFTAAVLLTWAAGFTAAVLLKGAADFTAAVLLKGTACAAFVLQWTAVFLQSFVCILHEARFWAPSSAHLGVEA